MGGLWGGPGEWRSATIPRSALPTAIDPGMGNLTAGIKAAGREVTFFDRIGR